MRPLVVLWTAAWVDRTTRLLLAHLWEGEIVAGGRPVCSSHELCPVLSRRFQFPSPFDSKSSPQLCRLSTLNHPRLFLNSFRFSRAPCTIYHSSFFLLSLLRASYPSFPRPAIGDATISFCFAFARTLSTVVRLSLDFCPFFMRSHALFRRMFSHGTSDKQQ